MDVCVELLAYNVWADEDDKTVFLSAGVDFWLVIFEITTNFLARGANEYYKTKIWEMRMIEKT